MGTSSSEKERSEKKERKSGDSERVDSGPIVTRRYGLIVKQNAQTQGGDECKRKLHRKRENKRRTHFELDAMCSTRRRPTLKT